MEDDNNYSELARKITRVLVRNNLVPRKTVIEDLTNLFVREVFLGEMAKKKYQEIDELDNFIEKVAKK